MTKVVKYLLCIMKFWVFTGRLKQIIAFFTLLCNDDNNNNDNDNNNNNDNNNDNDNDNNNIYNNYDNKKW